MSAIASATNRTSSRRCQIRGWYQPADRRGGDGDSVTASHPRRRRFTQRRKGSQRRREESSRSAEAGEPPELTRDSIGNLESGILNWSCLRLCAPLRLCVELLYPLVLSASLRPFASLRGTLLRL